jgi:hypothetical protein
MEERRVQARNGIDDIRVDLGRYTPEELDITDLSNLDDPHLFTSIIHCVLIMNS